MSQETTGTTSSYDNKIQKHLSEIEEFEAKLGLHANKIPYQDDFYQTILTFNLDELNKLTYQQCANYSVLLNQYAMYVLRLYNNFRSICEILGSKLDIMVCDASQSYQGSWDNKKQQAINNNSAAKELQGLLITYKEKCTRLYDLHNYIISYSDSIKNLQFAKMKEISHE
jgi:hypothetical protein